MPRRQHAMLDLTKEQERDREQLRERFLDDWPLYARTCLTILDRNPRSTRHRRIPFEFNACQQTLWELEQRIGDVQARIQNRAGLHTTRRPVRIIILKARKVGVSTYVQARLNHLCEFYQDTEALIMAHRQDAADNIAEMSRRFFSYFPDVQHPATKQRVDIRVPLANIGREITWDPKHGSYMRIKTAGSGTGRAKGGSRSYTYNAMHISEAAWFGDGQELSATLAAGTPDVICFQESTANGRGNSFYNSWENAMYIEELERIVDEGGVPPEKWNGYVRFFWPWFADPQYRSPLHPEEEQQIRATLDQAEQQLINEFGLDYQQLKWRRQKIHGECSDQSDFAPDEYFKQEYPSTAVEAFLTTGNAVFDQSRLEAMAETAERKAKKRTEKAGGRWGRWWRWSQTQWELRPSPWSNAEYVEFEPPKKKHWYVMGIDAAQGLEHGDNSVISVFDRTDGVFLDEVARYIGTTFDERELGELAHHIGERYNWAFIVGERNAPGNVTCLTLFDQNYPYLYYRDDEELIKPGDKDMTRFKVGFTTNLHTKPLIISKSAYVLRGDNIRLRSKQAIEEWRDFSRIDGKLGAPSGLKDDCVIADALAVFGHYDQQAPIIKAGQTPTKNSDGTVDDELTSEQKVKQHVQKQLTKMKARHASRSMRADKLVQSRALRAYVLRNTGKSVFD